MHDQQQQQAPQRSTSQLSRSRQNSLKAPPPGSGAALRFVQHERLKESVEARTSTVMLAALFLVAAGLALAVVGGMNIKGFIEHTTEILNPPPGTPAYIAEQAFKKAMPHKAVVSYFNVFVTSKLDGVNITELPTICDFLAFLQTELGKDPRTAPYFSHMGAYCFLRKLRMDKIADHLISPTNKTVTSPILCNVSRFDPAAKIFGDGVQDIVARAWPVLLNASAFAFPTAVSKEDFVVGVNGLSIFLTSIAATSKSDLTRALLVVMPVIALLVLLRLRLSITLTVCVLVSAGGHFCAALGVMRPVANDMQVSSPTPLLMFCLGIGLSLLYSMVVMTKFVSLTRDYFDPLFAAFAAGVPPAVYEMQLWEKEQRRRRRLTMSPRQRRRFDAKIRREEEQQQQQPGAAGDEDGDFAISGNVVAFDDALFEENFAHARADIIVDVVAHCAGPIIVSSCAVLLGVLMTVFFPASIIQSLGIGCVATVVAAFFYSVPFLIATLFAFFNFLAPCCYPSAPWLCLAKTFAPLTAFFTQKCCSDDSLSSECCDGGDDDDDEEASDAEQQQEDDVIPGADSSRRQVLQDSVGGGAGNSETAPLLVGGSFNNMYNNGSFNSAGSGSFAVKQQKEQLLLQQQQDRQRKPVLTRALTRCQRIGHAVRVVLVVASLALLLVVATKMRLSNAYHAYLGRDQVATKNYLEFTAQYGFGMVSPYRVLLKIKDTDANKNMTVFDEIFWNQTQDMVRRVLADPVLGDKLHMAGPIVIGPHLQNRDERILCYLGFIFPAFCPDESVVAFIQGQVASDKRSMYLMVTASFNPLGLDGWQMLQRILSVTAPPSPDSVYETFVDGAGPSSLDCVHAIYDRVPILAPVSVVVAMLVVLVYSRSLFDGLRFAVGLAWGLSVVLGSLTLVYQYGWGNWLGADTFKQIESSTGVGDVPWIGPVMVFAVALGLLTAFDILWAMTVARKGEYERESASMYYLALIVFVAFLGLSVSTVLLMNLVGLSLCVATIMGGVGVPREITMPVYKMFGERFG